MLWAAAVLVACHFCAHGLALPLDVPVPEPSLPALKAPIPCWEKESSASALKKKYVTMEDFIDSLDVDDVEEGAEWLHTDDGCFTSAETSLQALPSEVLDYFSDLEQRRWIIPVIRIGVSLGAKYGPKLGKLLSKIGKNGAKGGKKMPKKKPKGKGKGKEKDKEKEKEKKKGKEKDKDDDDESGKEEKEEHRRTTWIKVCHLTTNTFRV